MLTLAEYTRYDGLGLARLVARKEVSPQELVACAFAAMTKVNGDINAVLQKLPRQATASIAKGLPTAPFMGVPFVIKELVLQAKGVRQDMGSRLAQGTKPAADTELMARFRRAGLVLVGTTQTPELGYNPTTETVLHGPVHNPWCPTRSAGGSSGGSAAAVAAGIVPVGHANDGGGSIRIPAAANGLVGLKPTRDRIPSGPGASDPLCGLAIEFAVTRSVRDTAALLDAVAGADIGAPGVPPAPKGSFAKAARTAPGNLRIAFTTRSPSGEKIDPECRRAVETTVTMLAELGHELVESSPPLDWEPFLAATHVIWTAYTAQAIAGLAASTGRKANRDTLEAVTLACLRDGERYSAIDLLNAMAHNNLVSRQVGQFFDRFDVLVTPTMARLPAPLGEVDQNRAGMTAKDWTRQVFTYVPFTPLFNTTGQPAISLPLHMSSDGVPVGVQFAARFGAEATLLSLAGQLEKASPWAKRRPGIHAAN
jgi:amidase